MLLSRLTKLRQKAEMIYIDDEEEAVASAEKMSIFWHENLIREIHLAMPLFSSTIQPDTHALIFYAKYLSPVIERISSRYSRSLALSLFVLLIDMEYTSTCINMQMSI